MLRVIKRFGVTACYLFLMSIFFGFRMEKLFDIKQLLVFLLGTGLLLLPSLGEKTKGETREQKLRRVSFCALWSGFLESFLLCMTAMEQMHSRAELLSGVVLCLRPVFYGVCIWSIFAGETEGKRQNVQEEEKKENSLREITASESYALFQEMGLTRRECEIAILICQGMSNGEIAESFCISEATVKKHVSNIFEKLGCSRREQVRQRLFSGG